MDRTGKILKYCLVIVICLWLCAAGQDGNDEKILLQGRIWKHAEQIILKNYVREVTQEQLFEQALRGMIESLDSNSELIIAGKDNQQQPKKSIGIRIKTENGFNKILTPMRDLPAYQAGIWPEDELVSINDKKVANLEVDEIIKIINTVKDDEIKIKVNRSTGDRDEKKVLEFKVKRVVLPAEPFVLKSEFIDEAKGIVYVRLGEFKQDCEKELNNVLTNFRKNKMKALVLDMRDCTGGPVKSAVEVADLFLKEGIIVELQARDKDYAGVYRAKADGTLDNFPIVILVSETTSDAAEIVAGALQGNKRALVLGENTAGKASQTAVFKVDDKYSVRLTVANCLTPSGKIIQKNDKGAGGIVPDVENSLTEEQITDQLRARQNELLRQNCPPDAKKVIIIPDIQYEDPQIKAVTNLLRGMLAVSD